MNELREASTTGMPTPEQIVGRQVRLLRQGRGWSQQDVADKMRPYGYRWSQATVTRLESATRPIRVNELADLAMLFGIPVIQFLDPSALSPGLDDLNATERAIEELMARRAEIEFDLEHKRAVAQGAAQAEALLATDLARLNANLEIIRERYGRLRRAAPEVPEENDHDE